MGCSKRSSSCSLAGVAILLTLSFELREARASTEPVNPEADASAQIRARAEELSIPIYQRVRPTWAFELGASMQGLGTTALPGGADSKNLPAIQVRFEFQPAFVQSIGVLGVGISAQYYNLPTSVAPAGLSTFAVGAQARYQLKIFREQPLVPYAGYALSRFQYRLTDGGSGTFIAQGAFFGGEFLLNIFEPSAAAESFASTGIARTYAFVELRPQAGGDENFSLAGQTLFFGLRFEY